MNNQSFNTARIAAGYAKDRPFLHPQVMDEIRAKLCLTELFQRGLDLGCGAGLSTKALKLLCKDVTGTDISPEMIQAAQAICGEEGYSFKICKAEETPCDVQYDIVTAAGMVNWVEQEAFLRNLNPAMKPGAHLVIYDFWITDEMLGEKEYQTWWQQSYLPRFPKPFRKENVWTNEEIFPFGFSMKMQKPLRLSWDFDLDSFVRFMLIQSNVNEQISNGSISPEEAQEWFRDTLAPIFAGHRKTLYFTGYIWYLQKNMDCSHMNG